MIPDFPKDKSETLKGLSFDDYFCEIITIASFCGQSQTSDNQTYHTGSRGLNFCLFASIGSTLIKLNCYFRENYDQINCSLCDINLLLLLFYCVCDGCTDEFHILFWMLLKLLFK